jgi:DNA-binding transcriptional LysR family regulator
MVRLAGETAKVFPEFGIISDEWEIKMTDLNSLMIFAKVVEAKGFSEAARRLKMPTSTVSRRVADLEDQLGIRLLERSTRSLRLTDVGSEVLEHARHSAELSEAVDNIASNHLSNVSGEAKQTKSGLCEQVRVN